MGDGWLKRSLLVGAVAAVVVVAVIAGAYVFGGSGSQGAGADSDTVLIVFECADEDGTHVGWTALELDFEAGTLTSIETSVAGTLPGTGVSVVRDAYPFGGPGAVAAALAGPSDGAPPPALGVSAEDWEMLLGDGSGVSIELPGPVNVFDGDSLTRFPGGDTLVDGRSACALLVASTYMDEGLAAEVRAAVAAATAQALIAQPSLLSESAGKGSLASSVSEKATTGLSERAVRAIPTAEYRDR